MSILYESIPKDSFFIMAHRGFFGGNIIQNTCQSADLAIKAGADIIELDVAKNKDGDYYIFHTGYEKEIIGIDKPFAEITNSELREIYLINSIGMESNYQLNRLEDYLEWFPKDKFINIDRSWWYWDDPKFFDIIQNAGMKEHVFLKNNIMNGGLDYLMKLDKQVVKLPYLPIVSSRKEFEIAQQFEGINLIGVEILVQTPDSELIDPTFVKNLQERQMVILVDSEKLGRQKLFYFGYEDDFSILNNPEEGWGRMVKNGANIIETDWPNFLNDYRSNLK